MATKIKPVEKIGLIVGAAGLFIIVETCVLGVIFLANDGKAIPAFLGAIAGAAVTGGIQALIRSGQN